MTIPATTTVEIASTMVPTLAAIVDQRVVLAREELRAVAEDGSEHHVDTAAWALVEALHTQNQFNEATQPF